MKSAKFILITIILIMYSSIYAVEKVDEVCKAIRNKDIKAVKALVENGIDLEAYNEFGSTILITAVGNQNKEIVLYLLSKGANVNGKNDNKQTSPLLEAALNGNAEIAKILINKGANVNDLDSLHRAASRGNTKVVKVLLDAGADINKKDPNGNTPLIWAAGSGKIETTELLIKYGADVNAGDKGRTALYFVKRNRGIKSEANPKTYKKYEEIEKMLKEAGAKDVDMSKVEDPGL